MPGDFLSERPGRMIISLWCSHSSKVNFLRCSVFSPETFVTEIIAWGSTVRSTRVVQGLNLVSNETIALCIHRPETEHSAAPAEVYDPFRHPVVSNDPS